MNFNLYTFKNHGSEFSIHSDYCGGKNCSSIWFTPVMDHLISAELITKETVQGKIFKRKILEHYIELIYTTSYFDKEQKTKLIYVAPAELQKAHEAIAFLHKKLSVIEADKAAKRKAEEEKVRKRNEEAKRRIAWIDRLCNMNRSEIICLDVETTGIDKEKDEILQLSIIDGNGEILFNEYIQPRKRTSWKAAEAVHGISPAMVKGKPRIDEFIPRLDEIMENATLLVGYNSDDFDLDFIKNAGVSVPGRMLLFDVMLEFAPVYGKWDEYHQDYMWQKLTTCAKYYGYKFKAHDSLEDVRATLFCFYEMIQREHKKES